jgi:hypothetical protein
MNRHFSLDANVNLTSSSDGSTSVYGGRLSEYLFGARAEVRAARYQYFIEAQPGFLNWNRVITGVVFPTPLTFTSTYAGVDRFVSDMGGGVEYSPVKGGVKPGHWGGVKAGQ